MIYMRVTLLHRSQHACIGLIMTSSRPPCSGPGHKVSHPDEGSWLEGQRLGPRQTRLEGQAQTGKPLSSIHLDKTIFLPSSMELSTFCGFHPGNAYLILPIIAFSPERCDFHLLNIFI